ncbi:MAG: glycosyltransferase family 1 protein [Deltaproteobacteria bacterium]|nr:glycosyltransferase family 1 protein [Deltaproteobacteria bacterium]
MPTRRVMILLPTAGYYGVMGEALREAFAVHGVPVTHVCAPIRPHIETLDAEELRRALDEFAPTDVLSVNIPRRELPLPSGVSYHCWIQDPYCAEVKDGPCAEHVWMLIKHWVDWWGGKYLPCATDFGKYLDAPSEYDADIAIASAMPPLRMVFFPHDPVQMVRTNEVMGRLPDYLLESRRFMCDPPYAEELLARAEEETGITLNPALRPLALTHYQGSINRHVQRKLLLDALIPACQRRNWTLALVGPDWDRYPKYRPYHVGMLGGPHLARFYQRAKVNLHSNGDSNVHWRPLECLAAGAFVLSEAHHSDHEPGGFRSMLPEEVAPTFSGPEQLEEKLDYYLTHAEARRQAIEAGGEIVRRDHTFVQRAATILES